MVAILGTYDIVTRSVINIYLTFTTNQQPSPHLEMLTDIGRAQLTFDIQVAGTMSTTIHIK